jgi:hypothetical protein
MPAARAPALRAVTKQSLGRLDLDHGPSPVALRVATERLRSRARSRPLRGSSHGHPRGGNPASLAGLRAYRKADRSVYIGLSL